MTSVMRADASGLGEDAATTTDTSADALKARLSRKRTKTGCLTCRKRRIKCGEERPICKNCVKSKRQCEGYSQRVVYREPTFDYQPTPHGGAHITFQAGAARGGMADYQQDFHQSTSDPAYHQYNLPNPSFRPAVPARQSHLGSTYNGPHYVPLQPSVPVASIPEAGYSIPSSLPPHTSQGAQAGLYQLNVSQNATPNASVHAQTSQAYIPPAIRPAPVSQSSYPPITAHWQHDSNQTWSHAPQPTNTAFDGVSPTSDGSDNAVPWRHVSNAEVSPPGWGLAVNTAHSELQRQVGQPSDVKSTRPPMSDSHTISHQNQNHLEPSSRAHDQYQRSGFLSQAAVETQDDDYYDVHSEDEMDIDTLAVTTIDHERQRDLHQVLQINGITPQDLQTRRYDTFIYEGILDHYRVEDAANPLRNPATARVFAHFIAVTGPSVSLFERKARNASVFSNEAQIPFSQQGLWTYAMPVAALRHQGLLHSMLALASLHIARLLGESDTPSRQHYAWACKRINRLLGPNSKKRHKTTTIAASMLLGFYEIFTADHRAWNLHLTGSRQLFAETDFSNLTKQFRRMKRDRTMRQHLDRQRDAASSNDIYQDEILDQIYDVDESIISQIVGKEVKYDDHGQVMTPLSGLPEEMNLSNFEILRDLYWWYLKQDVFQSILSGNSLLLDYSRWADCPPRAPLGDAEAIYGSYDHLILLLGRIADFAARDRQRKLKQMEVNGGQWRPAPGMNLPGPPRPQQPPPATPVSATQGQMPAQGLPAPAQAPPQEPAFYGMAPHTGYSVPPSHVVPPEEVIDLHTATQAALEEYGRIRAQLLAFESSLGEAFSPLTSEYQVPLETPFGEALFYRSYDIGCLWAVYYMAVIVAIRSHPHMHPAAHVAAALASQETAFFANRIGQINAGIVPGPPDQPLNPTLGAALCESCMPSFFAAIQYTDPQQRYVTVMRTYGISLRIGWGSAEVIASGCETAWVKAAAAGRGPPYTRVRRPHNSDDPRLNGSWENVNPHEKPDEDDDKDRRLISTNTGARIMWAIGVMGTEDDEKTSKLTS